MKKVAIIGTVGVPGRYGGFETLAHQLVNNLSGQVKFKVYCSSKAYKKEERVKYYNRARLHYIPLSANGVQSILYDFISIIHALFVADTLIILGVSGGLILPFVRIFTNRKIIVNIDGLEWRRAKWNPIAKAFLRFSERLAVRWSHADITDNEAIKRYTTIHYKTLSHLIEYGGDHAVPIGPTGADAVKFPFIYEPYAFKVARIEPENNIHLILSAFSQLKEKLVVVGNWDRSAYGTDLKRRYAKYNNLLLLDPIYNQHDLDVLRSNCLLYVHGHSAGGTNPSLVEAMNLSLPVLAFDCSYNRATTEDKALYFKTEEQLQQKIIKTSFAELIGQRSTMKEIAQRRYQWKTVAAKYSNLIHAFDHQWNKQTILSDLSGLNKETLLKIGMAHMKNPTPYYKNI